MAKRPPRPRQTDTPTPPVPEPPDRESLTDQAARLAQEWGLPGQERQIYEALVVETQLSEEERRLENRGGGARIPTWPRASGHPTLDKAHTEVMRLHGLHGQLVDDVVGAFVAARKARPEGEDDPVQGLADRIFREHLPAIEQQRKRAARALAALRRTLTTAAPDPEKGPAAAKRAELARLARGLPYAMTWVLLAVHQLAPLAVAHILKLRVLPQHLGARVQIMLAAYQALDRPWGQGENGAVSLPVEEFDLAKISQHWNELMQESIEDLRVKIALSQKLRGPILKREGLLASYCAEDLVITETQDALAGTLHLQVGETCRSRWGDFAWPKLERLARDGKLDVALLAIHNGLIGLARQGLCRRRSPCPNCKAEGRPATMCRRCGTRIPWPSEPRAVSLDDDAEGEEGKRGPSGLEQASYELHQRPEQALEIMIVEPPPDYEAARAEAGPRIKELFTEPTLLKMLEALRAGKETQPEIAASLGVTDRTIRNWQKDLRERYPDLIGLFPELLQFPLPGETPGGDQR